MDYQVREGLRKKVASGETFGEALRRVQEKPTRDRKQFLLTSQIVLQPKAKPWASGLEASLDRLLGVPLRDQQRAPKHHQRPPRLHLPVFSLQSFFDSRSKTFFESVIFEGQ